MADVTSSTNDIQVQTESMEAKKLMYGWKCVTSESIQCLNKPVVFIIILSISILIESIITGGYKSSTVSSIEKEFGLSSTQVSTFNTMFFVSGGIVSAFVGYIGSSRKPLFLAIGGLFLSIGSLIICLPKLFIGPYEPSVEINHFCTANTTSQMETMCKSSKSWTYQLTFIVGHIFYGIGVVPIYTIGYSHIDDIFSRDDAAKYMAVIMTNRLLGLAAGYLIAMPLLQVWVDLHEPSNHFDPTHPNWVGAWWIGYLGGAIILLLVAIPMSGFPSQFPNTEGIRIIKKSLPDTIAENGQITSWWTSTKAFTKNKVFLLITLSTTLEELIKPGAVLFMPKFLETQFHFSASMSALYSGIPLIIGGVTGTMFSGFIINRFKWNCRQIIRFSVITTLLATISSAIILIPCNSDVKKSTPSLKQHMECNKNCNCKSEYHPLCTTDRESFFSPCYTGCSVENQVNNTFFNCSCFSHNSTIGKDRRCMPENCELFPLFFIGLCLLFFFIIVNEVPLKRITFRVVNEGQASAAIGFQKTVAVFFGSLPSPPIFGVFIDVSCILWATDECSDKNNCLEYDTIHFGYYFFGITILLNFLVFCSLMCADILYELPNLPMEVSHIVAIDNNAYSIDERNRSSTDT